MLSVTLKDLKIIWNTKPLLNAVDRAKANTLKQFGAYTRKIAKNSIKTSSDPNKHAAAGQPPIGHTGPTRYKDWIFYYYDAAKHEVVIGAIRLPRKDSQLVPETLERGGTAMAPKKRQWGGSIKIPRVQRARPHMRPAYDKAVEILLPKLIENSIVP